MQEPGSGNVANLIRYRLKMLLNDSIYYPFYHSTCRFPIVKTVRKRVGFRQIKGANIYSKKALQRARDWSIFQPPATSTYNII